MPKVIYIQPNGVDVEIEASTGSTLMEVALNNGVDGMLAECGGCCSCATCHCYIDEVWMDIVGAAEGNELAMLDFAKNPENNSRLACQIEITDAMNGLVVKLPESQF